MAFEIDKAKELAEDLQRAVAKLLDRIGQVSTSAEGTAREQKTEEAAELAREFSQKAELLSRMVAERGLAISDVFREVGQSVVLAQRELDEQSRAYQRTSPLLPAMFRIPKVTAELQFALETTQSTSLNVLIFGTSKKQREAQQHKIQVDVVAAPLPPELQLQTAAGPVAGKLVADAVRYAEVRAALEDYIRRMAALTLASVRTVVEKCEGFLARWPRVLVLEAGERLALLRATEDTPAGLDLLYVHFSARTGAGDPYLPRKKESGTELRGATPLVGMAVELASIVDELAALQASHLARVGGARPDAAG
jgi:hypothetical protein